MKTRQKRKQKFVLTEEQRRALFIPVIPSTARSILYRAKVGSRKDSLAVAKYFAEEIRADPENGFSKLGRTLERQWRQWRLKGEKQGETDYFKSVGKMLSTLGAYLEKDQSVFSKDDHDIIEIVMQHPCYTNGEIVAELSKRHPTKKLATLEKSVTRLLGSVHWRRYLKNVPVRLL